MILKIDKEVAEEVNLYVDSVTFWQKYANLPEFYFTMNKEHKAEMNKDNKLYKIYIKND